LNSVLLNEGEGAYDATATQPLMRGRTYTYFRTLAADDLWECVPDGTCHRLAEVPGDEVPPDAPTVPDLVVSNGLVEPALMASAPAHTTTGQRVVVEVGATAAGLASVGGTVTVRGSGTHRAAGHAALHSGKARVSLGKLKAGSYTLTATYAGNDRVAGAQRIIGTLTVTKAKATVTVKAPAKVRAGHRARITVKVTAPGIAKMRGRVRITAAGQVVATKKLPVSGRVHLKLPKAKATKAATLRVKAVYLGSGKAKPGKAGKATIRITQPQR
jgi:hypothetical protein